MDPTNVDADGAGKPTSAATRSCTIVTGASEGIGLALAHTFAASQRDPVLMIARSATTLEPAAAAVHAATGIQTIALCLDVTAADAAERIDAILAANSLHVGILINNAGVGLGGPFAEHSPTDVARLIDLNVRALTLLTRHVLPGLLQRGTGGIINIASLGGFAPGPYQAAYYASKAYVLSLTRALSWEIAGSGVHACVVTPGPVETKFHARMGADAAFYRHLMPAMTANAVARSTWRGWRIGLHVIQPGVFTPLLSLAMRVLPWLMLVPLVGWLLRKRYRNDKQ